MRMLSYLTVWLTLMAASCSPNSHKQSEVTWSESVHLDKMEWKLNHEYVGHGLTGYRALIQHLETLDNGAVVTICYPGNLWNEETEAYVLHDVLPFGAREDLRKEFQELMLRKDLLINHKAL